MTPAASNALIGTSTTTEVVGPFLPQLGREINLTLLGTNFTGTIQLLRSRDAGVNKLPRTYSDGSAKPLWTGNVNCIVDYETVAGVSYWLSFVISAGSISYRLEQ